MIRQYEISVYGRVQGVGFRYAARDRARILGLKGWVENRLDGSVQSVIQGEEMACRKYMAWCREGTGYSWVERLEVREIPATSLPPFSIKR
jgi:acylphosphatase